MYVVVEKLINCTTCLVHGLRTTFSTRETQRVSACHLRSKVSPRRHALVYQSGRWNRLIENASHRFDKTVAARRTIKTQSARILCIKLAALPLARLRLCCLCQLDGFSVANGILSRIPAVQRFARYDPVDLCSFRQLELYNDGGLYVIPVKMFWKASSTLLASRAEVSINDRLFSPTYRQ